MRIYKCCTSLVGGSAVNSIQIEHDPNPLFPLAADVLNVPSAMLLYYLTLSRVTGAPRICRTATTAHLRDYNGACHDCLSARSSIAQGDVDEGAVERQPTDVLSARSLVAQGDVKTRVR